MLKYMIHRTDTIYAEDDFKAISEAYKQSIDFYSIYTCNSEINMIQRVRNGIQENIIIYPQID